MTIQEIENAVRDLSREDLARFRAWFLEYDAGAWDRELEEDVAAGRLEAFANEALARLHPDDGGPAPMREMRGFLRGMSTDLEREPDRLLAE